MLVTVIASGITLLLQPKSSIMTEKLARRGLRIHQDYEADVLQQVTVSETMDREVPAIPSNMPIGELATKIAHYDPEVTRHHGLVVLDEQNNLAGIITRGDLMRALDKDSSGATTVLDAGTRNVVVTFPDEVVHEASAKMLRYNIGRLPVVDRKEPHHVVGYLGRPGILSARRRRLEEEHLRELGWLKALF